MYQYWVQGGYQMEYVYKKIKCHCCGNYFDAVDFGNDFHDGEICPICFWQFDEVGQEKVEISIGPNKVSLADARENYKKFGASTERLKQFVRKPNVDELPENNE